MCSSSSKMTRISRVSTGSAVLCVCVLVCVRVCANSKVVKKPTVRDCTFPGFDSTGDRIIPVLPVCYDYLSMKSRAYIKMW